jgi:methylthioribose-1-phosphate isomerase
VSPESIRWLGDADGSLRLLDQTRLPAVAEELEVREVPALIEAIQALVVRGAPAIGVAGAYGVVLAAQEQAQDPLAAVLAACPALRDARPTAVNLGWAIDRMEHRARELAASTVSTQQLPAALLAEARRIHDEDRLLCEDMARHGAPLLSEARRVLTHCNTGACATGGIGTALGVIRRAHESGSGLEVFAGETRPLLQGARLTAWELRELGIPCTIVPDSAGAGLILQGQVDAVLVGADRIAANGDFANKLGTLPLALAAGRAGVPFFVVAPSTSFDLQLPSGAAIPIEQRDGSELVLYLREGCWPEGVPGASPAFDVTPHDLVTAIVCEHGVIERPDAKTIKELLAASR